MQHALRVTLTPTTYYCRPSGSEAPSSTSGLSVLQSRVCRAHQTASNASSVPTASAESPPANAKDVLTRYYEAYNAGDIGAISQLLAPDVSYHDLIYEDPFEGREAVVAYLKKVRSIVPHDLQFVIEDITDGDPRKVGITWHVECGEGTVFPFSRGCSFYTLNGQGQIVSARDLVESAVKPGSSALQLLGAMAPLVRKLGPNADPSVLKKLPIASAAIWAFYAGYTAFVMLSSDAPGAPAYATPPEVLQEVLYESLNFFYINIGLTQLGLTPVPSVACPPVSEAVFNFVNAWSLMALPLILSDGRCRKLGGTGTLVSWWAGIMFLTNVFYIPFLALRAAPEPSPTPGAMPPRPPPSAPLPSWAPVFGATGLAVGLFSIGWALAGRPETGGDLAVRWQYLVDTLSTNRVFWAFAVDACLYSVWQAALMPEDAPAKYRFLPFFGLAAYLMTASSNGSGDGGRSIGGGGSGGGGSSSSQRH